MPLVTILGGGASGITTGLTLQLLGYRTRIISAQFPEHPENERDDDPLFASLYPAASIIPHSVRNERMDILYQDSHQVFRQLHESGIDIIRQNRHYEWFRFPVSDPVYREWMKNFNPINSSENLTGELFDSDADQVHGWFFNCYFVDWPRYVQWLYEQYQAAGGKLERRKVTAGNVTSLDSSLVVNCTGAYSRELFEDPEDFCFMLGKTLVVEDAPDPNELDSIISYNYTPGSEIYSHSSGKAIDVYLYPRKSGWVLGGSRLHGHLDSKGRWLGEQWTGRMLSIDQQQVPAPIYEINRDLIQKLYDIDIADYTLRAKSGYRFMRDSQTEGIRLEATREYGKYIFHNYGHGGGGITLSWGCALQVARMMRNYKRPSSGNTLQDNNFLINIKSGLKKLF